MQNRGKKNILLEKGKEKSAKYATTESSINLNRTKGLDER